MKTRHLLSRNFFLIAAVGLPLSGCVTTGTPAPAPIQVDGPRVSSSSFVCPAKPAAPDAAHRRAADAVKYSERMEARGDRCADQLQAVGSELRSAGQVVE